MSGSLNGISDPEKLRKRLPEHIAIIMDGNGRWAKQRGLERLEGHRAGAKSVRAVVEECRRLGIRYLTLFSFSTENWNRSKEEVGGLMDLFRRHLQSELSDLLKHHIRLRAVGDVQRLPIAVRKALAHVEEKTKKNKELELILAISYGGREEIVAAARILAEKAAAGTLRPDEIDSKVFAGALWTAGIPDPDLLIRTSGEMRISNFLLWQLAYAEIVVAPEYWPEFDAKSLGRCLEVYSRRERRFGLTSEQVNGSGTAGDWPDGRNGRSDAPLPSSSE